MGTSKIAALVAVVVAMGIWATNLSAHRVSLGQKANAVSPVRGVKHKASRNKKSRQRPRSNEYRTIDGTDNNKDDPLMGSAGQPLGRWLESDYSDGISTMAGSTTRPGAREVSSGVAFQSVDNPNPHGASDFLWQWGQFLDHDIDLTDGMDPPEPQNVSIPVGDSHFPPHVEIPFNRSIYDVDTDPSEPRQQLNEITAWIDGSNVYGSNQERADALRTLDGTGRLKTSDGNMLPFNDVGLPNAGGSRPELYLAGDVRSNEQLGLTAMHILFLREHNRLADSIAARNPNWTGDQIYEKARQLVGAQIQFITYNEFLPALLGKRAMRKNIGRYRGYRSDVSAGIANMFSTAAYRFGHSAISVLLKRVEADGSESPFGHLELRNAFFRPDRLATEGGIEPILRGLSTQAMQAVDAQVVDELRNFLFGDPSAGGLDLAALNIQRGRDHGLPSYNDTREANGFGRATDWSDITSDPDMQERLYMTYSSVDDIDLWVGGLFEDAIGGSHLGPLFTKLVSKQFALLRDGDRYWYQIKLTRAEIKLVEASRLSKIIRRNTEIGYELPDNIFKAQELRPLLSNIKVRGKRRSPFGRPRGITISKRKSSSADKGSSASKGSSDSKKSSDKRRQRRRR